MVRVFLFPDGEQAFESNSQHIVIKNKFSLKISHIPTNVPTNHSFVVLLEHRLEKILLPLDTNDT